MEKGSFQKGPFSRDFREFRDSRDFRQPPDCGKRRRIRPFPRDSREFRAFRDSRDSSSEKTPFGTTPFSGPELNVLVAHELCARNAPNFWAELFEELSCFLQQCANGCTVKDKVQKKSTFLAIFWRGLIFSGCPTGIPVRGASTFKKKTLIFIETAPRAGE